MKDVVERADGSQLRAAAHAGSCTIDPIMLDPISSSTLLVLNMLIGAP